VVITDQLDVNLDWTTFSWTGLGFGDQLVLVPPDTQHFQTNLPVSYLDFDFDVHVELSLRLALGQVYAVFQSIDPATSLPPLVDIGFLPPEDGTGRGCGHISYTIKAREGLATDTEIRNVALISFDSQPVIATNQKDPHDPTKGSDPTKECLNTIDATPPVSSVLELPSTSNDLFPVSWLGSDIGVGLATYDIYVSDNGGPWTLWLDNTTSTTAVFLGEGGHTYAFFSVARDGVGLVEPAPDLPDATTMILLPLRITDVQYSEGVQFTWASSPAATYTVWSRTNLVSGTWVLEDTLPSQGDLTTWQESVTSSAEKFFRIRTE
jgi:hypothetical protein